MDSDIKDINNKVLKIIADVLNLEPEKIKKNNILRNEFTEWDSLKHISIVAALENYFDIQFEPEEISEINDSEKIVKIIYEKLGY